jgi:hypothetical protein
MTYDTLRSLCEISPENHVPFLEAIWNKGAYFRFLKNQKGKEIIVLENAIFSNKNELQKGFFRGGMFKEIQFYENKNGLEGNILFEDDSLIKLNRLYDIMFLDSVTENSQNKDSLKLFSFVGTLPNGLELSSIIESDPFLAYSGLMKGKGIQNPVQELVRIESIKKDMPIKKGVSFYIQTIPSR